MLKFVSIFDADVPEAKIKKLYRHSFPLGERVPYFLLKAKAKKNLADFYIVCDGSLFAGMLYQVYHKDIVYLFYIAIEPSLRGRGYGSALLHLAKEQNGGKRMILSIEALEEESGNYEQRVKRKKFYLKNEFQENRLITREGNITYEMLCYGGNVSYEEYGKLIEGFLGTFLYKRFYRKIEGI